MMTRSLQFSCTATRPKLKMKLAKRIPTEASYMIKWSAVGLKSSREVRKALENRRNADIYLAPESWKKDLPLLSKTLGLKYQANAEDVSMILKSKSSSVFSVKAIEAAGFVPSDPQGSTEVISCVEVGIEETKSVRVKIKIPMQYEDELASGNPRSGSKRREEFELLLKSQLSDAFGVPKSLLEPEVHIAEIQEGSVIVTVILSTSALVLILAGQKLTQTVTWQEKKFEILMGMEGAAAGSIVGVIAGGPVGAAIGLPIGWCAGLATAWFLNRDVQDASARAQAYFGLIGTAIVAIIRFFDQDHDD